jgi:Winged helix DNA-binding domain
MKRARTSPKVLSEDIKALQANPAGLRSVHLLPYFDVYLLAHSTKEHFLDARFYKRVYRNQGWISPVVLVDGEIAGVWGHKLARTGIKIEAELFAPVARSVREQIEVRAKELADLFRRPFLFSFRAKR